MVNNRSFLSSVLLPALLVAGMRVPMHGLNSETEEQPVSTSAPQPTATDVTGTWSGTFYSKHSNVAPFTITVVISADAVGHLTGSSSLNSDCLKGAQLHVTLFGSKIVLAGGDPEGDNITVRGTLDNTSRQIATTYVLNGAATGKCETDDGNGNLGKR
jgi:hypothetical protein